MLNRFVEHIAKEHLIAHGQQVLLAVSGGRDSVAMADLMVRAGYRCGLAHCNFNLRPGDCDRDEAFVCRLAVDLQLPFYIANFDTVEYATEHGLSVEEAARELRYAFFEEVRVQEGYDLIATAHHADDAIETFFINLIRGTGIAGLRGIPRRNGAIIRPMLPFSRKDIDDYIAERGLSFVEDYTNAQTLYLRNRIRHMLLPVIREISPSFDATMQDNMRNLDEACGIYRDAVDEVANRLLQPADDGYEIDIASLRSLSPLRTYLFELLRPFGFSSSVVNDIISSLDAQSGKQFFSPTHRLLKDRERLFILPNKADELEEYVITKGITSIEKPVALMFDIVATDGKPIKLGKDEAWFDNDKLEYPLVLRHWHDGDRFTPFGMKGSRLLSDLFSDMKMNRAEKEKVWILCDANNEILWVVGIRASARCAVSKSTENVLRCRFQISEIKE